MKIEDYAPLIGITDFTHPDQVRAMLRIFNANRRSQSERKLHVGVMTSYKVLNGFPTKWTQIFPKKEDIAGIFTPLDVYNCLHYVDYEHGHGEISFDLFRAIRYGGRHIHALQLDMVWPDPGSIQFAINRSEAKPEVILQIGAKAFEVEEVNNDPNELARNLDKYMGRRLNLRVLLDKSMGRGIGMNAEELLPYARAIRERFPDLPLIVAGGLGPSTMHLVEPMLPEFPDISVDAQGQLHIDGDPLKPVDWGRAGRYLVEALKRLK